MAATNKDDSVPSPGTATSEVASHMQIDSEKRLLDDKGTLSGKADSDSCTERPRKRSPHKLFKSNFEAEELSEEFCNELCSDASYDSEGRFLDFEAVLEKLKQIRPDVQPWSAKMVVENIQTENVENHSKAPLSVAQNLTQLSGLATPPAENSSSKLTYSSSSSDSKHTKSSFVSAQEEKTLSTNHVFIRQETAEPPKFVGGVPEDDGTIAEQSRATRSDQGSGARNPTSGPVPMSRSMVPESMVTSERKNETSLSQRSVSGFHPREVAVSQIPSVEKLKLSTFDPNQPFIFSAPNLSTTERETSLVRYATPRSHISQSLAQNVAPKPSSPQQITLEQSRPQQLIPRQSGPQQSLPPSAKRYTVCLPHQPSQKQLAASSSVVVERPVSETAGPTKDNRTQEIPSSDSKLESVPNDSGSISTQSQRLAPIGSSTPAKAHAQSPAMPDPDEELHRWIHKMYSDIGFDEDTCGFIGWPAFSNKVLAQEPDKAKHTQIRQALKLIRPGTKHKNSLPQISDVQTMKAKARRERLQNAQGPSSQPATTGFRTSQPTTSPPESRRLQLSALSFSTPNAAAASSSVTQASGSHVLASQSAPPPPVFKDQSHRAFSTDGSDQAQNSINDEPDFAGYSKFLKNGRKVAGGKAGLDERAIKQGPLLSGEIINKHWKDLVPQFGLLGSLAEQDTELLTSQIYSNPNTPASVFICGVQGSGKSHTTACLLENSIISSGLIGRLHAPVSCLVYSWSDNSGSTSFSVSEIAYLGASLPNFPGHHAKRVTVLYSPSNPVMRKHYAHLPNVKAIPFYLNPKKLTIGAMLTLMAVDESSKTPLYLVQVEEILRSMQRSKGEDTILDYGTFKRKLAEVDFTRDQKQPLQIRLNILESFLDLSGKAAEPTYAPGEVTIMDLSDGTMSSSTACALFKLGMDEYLGSSTKGKMIVLDEAHKYMQDTPGAHLFAQGLKGVITQMRHKGARVVISTQEPTIANELIALCSMTIMHRFTSPTWFSALKKHISVVEDDTDVMRQLEGLNTGEALVYAPSAVLDKNEDGSLVKATGQLLRIIVRDRITQDGGESILAV